MYRDYLELPVAVRILCCGALVNRAGSFVLIFLTIYASEEMGFGVPFATACIGVLGFGSLIGAMLGGHLADLWGRRTVMLSALVGGGCVLLLLGELDNRWVFMGTVGLFALTTDMYRPAAAAMIADVVGVNRRAHAFALMYISINFGFAIAPPLGGWLAEFSFRWLFWADALTMFAFGLMILLFIPESRPFADGSRGSTQSSAISVSEAARQIASDRPFVLFCIATLLSALVFMQGMSTLPIHIRQSGFSNLQFGWLMSINGIMIFLLQLPMTHWLSRFRPMSVLVCGGLLIAIGFAMNALSSELGFLAMTITIWTLGEILEAPFSQSIVTSIAPERFRGRYVGLFSMCFGFALTIGAPLGGIVLNRYGPQVLWAGTFGVAMGAVAIYLTIHDAITRRVEESIGGT